MDYLLDLAEYQLQIPASIHDPVVLYDPRWRADLEPYTQYQGYLIGERAALASEWQRVLNNGNRHVGERDRIGNEIRRLTRRKNMSLSYMQLIRSEQPDLRLMLVLAAYYFAFKREIANLCWDRNRVDEYVYMTSVERVRIEDGLRRNAESWFHNQYLMYYLALAAKHRLDAVRPRNPDLYPLPLGSYLELLQSLLVAKTEPCPPDSIAGETINPTGCFTPKRIIPWHDFAQKQDEIWARIMTSDVGWTAEYPPKGHLLYLFSRITIPVSNDSVL